MENEKQSPYSDNISNSVEPMEREFRLLCKSLKENADSNVLLKDLTSYNLGYQSLGKNFGLPNKSDYGDVLFYIFSMIKMGSSAILLNEKRSELKDLQAKYDELNRKSAVLENENKRLTIENERLKGYENKYREMEYLKKSIQTESEKLGQKNVSLIFENNKLKSENENLHYQNQVLTIQKDALKLDNDTFQENFNNLHKMYDLMCETHKSVMETHGDIIKRNMRLENDCNTYMEQIKNWQNSCIDQAEQIQQLEEKYVLDDSARKKSLEKRRNHTELMKQRVIKQIEQYLWEYCSRHNWKYLKRVPVNDIAMLCGCCSDNVRKYVKEIGDTYPSIIGENYKCYQAWYDAGHKFTGGHNMKRVKTKK